VVHHDRVIEPVVLPVYIDADYANDSEDRKSVSGYVTMMDGATVSFGSRKQEINALSTMDEYKYRRAGRESGRRGARGATALPIRDDAGVEGECRE
jgi:hypothetical protein